MSPSASAAQETPTVPTCLLSVTAERHPGKSCMRPRPEQLPLHLKPPLIKSDVRLIGGFGDASPSVEFRAAVRQVTRGVTRGGFYEIEVVDLTTHLPAFVPEGGAFLNLERAIYRADNPVGFLSSRTPDPSTASASNRTAKRIRAGPRAAATSTLAGRDAGESRLHAPRREVVSDQDRSLLPVESARPAVRNHRRVRRADSQRRPTRVNVTKRRPRLNLSSRRTVPKEALLTPSSPTDEPGASTRS